MDSYEKGDTYIKVRILPITTNNDNYSPSASTTYFTGYPYGWYLATTYYGDATASISCAIYNKYSAHGLGWKIFDLTKNGTNNRWDMQDTGDYQRSEVVFYFKGNGDATKTVRPTNLFWIKSRVTDFSEENSNFNKSVNQTLVNDLIFKNFGTQKARISARTGDAYFHIAVADSFTENGTSLANKYLGKTAKAADSNKLNGEQPSYY